MYIKRFVEIMELVTEGIVYSEDPDTSGLIARLENKFNVSIIEVDLILLFDAWKNDSRGVVNYLDGYNLAEGKKHKFEKALDFIKRNKATYRTVIRSLDNDKDDEYGPIKGLTVEQGRHRLAALQIMGIKIVQVAINSIEADNFCLAHNAKKVDEYMIDFDSYEITYGDLT